MKSRHKESVLPKVPHQTLPPKLIYRIKFFKHKNWGNKAISFKTTSIEVMTLKPIQNTQGSITYLFWNLKSSHV